MSEPCTCERCNAKQNRIAAFGAIRRAVALAREYDADSDYEGFYDEFREQRFQDALDVRRAIRAAIRSDKA